MEILILLIVVGLITVVGHLIWLMLAAMGRALMGISEPPPTPPPPPPPGGDPVRQQPTCPECETRVPFQAQSCPFCRLDLSGPAFRQLGDLKVARRVLHLLAAEESLDADTYTRLDGLLDRQRLRTLGHGPKVVRRQTASPPPPAPPKREEILDAIPVLEEAPPRPALARREPPPPVVPAAAPAVTAVATPPRRPVAEVLVGFMEQRNILWGELVGGLLIVGCSIALVLTLWNSLQQLPYFPFLLFSGLTAALFGAGLYTHAPLEARGHQPRAARDRHAARAAEPSRPGRPLRARRCAGPGLAPPARGRRVVATFRADGPGGGQRPDGCRPAPRPGRSPLAARPGHRRNLRHATRHPGTAHGRRPRAGPGDPAGPGGPPGRLLPVHGRGGPVRAGAVRPARACAEWAAGPGAVRLPRPGRIRPARGAGLLAVCATPTGSKPCPRWPCPWPSRGCPAWRAACSSIVAFSPSPTPDCGASASPSPWRDWPSCSPAWGWAGRSRCPCWSSPWLTPPRSRSPRFWAGPRWLHAGSYPLPGPRRPARPPAHARRRRGPRGRRRPLARRPTRLGLQWPGTGRDGRGAGVRGGRPGPHPAQGPRGRLRRRRGVPGRAGPGHRLEAGQGYAGLLRGHIWPARPDGPGVVRLPAPSLAGPAGCLAAAAARACGPSRRWSPEPT